MAQIVLEDRLSSIYIVDNDNPTKDWGLFSKNNMDMLPDKLDPEHKLVVVSGAISANYGHRKVIDYRDVVSHSLSSLDELRTLLSNWQKTSAGGGYDDATGTIKTTNQNEPQYHWTDSVPIVDESSLAAGTYYSSVINNDSFKHDVIGLRAGGPSSAALSTGVVFKAYASMISDPITPGDTGWDDEWEDVSDKILKATSVTHGASDQTIHHYYIDTDLKIKHLCIQYVVDSADDGDANVDVFIEKYY